MRVTYDTRARSRRDVCSICAQVCAHSRRDALYACMRARRDVMCICRLARLDARMCAGSSRFMHNTAMRARRNLESLVENNIPRRDHRSIVRLDWFEKSRLDHLE